MLVSACLEITPEVIRGVCLPWALIGLIRPQGLDIDQVGRAVEDNWVRPVRISPMPSVVHLVDFDRSYRSVT